MIDAGVADQRTSQMELWFRRTGDSAVGRCRNQTEAAPRVAFCVAGSARGFATPLGLASLQHHLIRPLAPHRHTKAFVLLKSSDSDKVNSLNNNDPSFKSHRERVSRLPNLVAALETPWLQQLIGEAVSSMGAVRF